MLQHDAPETDSRDTDHAQSWTIAELSAQFGVTPRALRFYEERGLLSPGRSGGQRIYTARDRARLLWIERAKSVGFSLTEVGEMLDLYDLGDGRKTQRKVTLERCREQLGKLQNQREDIDWAIGVLGDFIATVAAEVDSQDRKD